MGPLLTQYFWTVARRPQLPSSEATSECVPPQLELEKAFLR